MSMEDGDLYREESHQRRSQAERDARPGWNRAEGQGNRVKEPIPLHLTPLRATLPFKPPGLVLVFGALALTLIRGEHGKIAWPPFLSLVSTACKPGSPQVSVAADEPGW